MFKRKQVPTVECQNKSNSYRKKTSRFEQFAYILIHKIVQRGRNNGNFVIPDELAFSEDIVKVDEKVVPAGNQRKLPTSHLHRKSIKRRPNFSLNSSTTTSDLEQKVKRKIVRNIHEYFDVVAPKGQTRQKLANAAPYNFFLTASIRNLSLRHFDGAVRWELGCSVCANSVQINFIVDMALRDKSESLNHVSFKGTYDPFSLISVRSLCWCYTETNKPFFQAVRIKYILINKKTTQFKSIICYL